MQALLNLQSKLLSLNQGVVLLLIDTFNDLKAQIEDKITEQLSRGERGDGEHLPNYSPVSVAIFGKRSGPMTLYETGDFYKGVTVYVDAEGIIIADIDDKAAMLIERYGEEIIELQDQSIDELQEDAIIPTLQSKVINFLTQ